MNKKYKDNQDEPLMSSQPVAAYEVRRPHCSPNKCESMRERIMANTVSVDEYFDELISLVHHDYATL